MWWGRLTPVACLAVLAVVGTAPAGASSAKGRAAPVSLIVVDADSGAVLAEHDADRPWPPASMAKMMTVLLALEDVRAGRASLDDPVRVSEKASRMGGSQVYLAAGETFSLAQLLEAVMIPSANDASVAVAEHLAGSTEVFVDRMNRRAAELGMTGTRYRTVHGLPPEPGAPGDLTTARDLAILGRALRGHPEAARWAATPELRFRNGTLVLHNTNHLLRTYRGATGLKTGYFAAAGFSVTATARRGETEVLAVVLGMPTKQGCFDEAARLLTEAFSTWKTVVAARRGLPLGRIPVAGGSAAHVRAIPAEDLRVLVRRGDDEGLRVEARVPRLLRAPVRRHQPLGQVVVRRGDRELGRVTVIADREVPATGWLGWLWQRPAQLARHEPAREPDR